MLTEIRDVAEGLWVWQVEHPAWRPGLDWEPLVASTCVESRGGTTAPPTSAPSSCHLGAAMTTDSR